MKLAIIGSGISGLSAAYALQNAGHEITLYEKNDYLGGHSRTIDINVDTETTAVDTGFIVFNYRNYPHLTKLFKHLGVPVEKSDMSFGVDIDNGWLQYSSNNMLNRMKNITRLRYWRMLFDIIKFNYRAPLYLKRNSDITIDDCLNELNMGDWFRNYYLHAMGAAIWSCPIETIKSFPAKTFITFFQNHGLLTIFNQPQWYTVTKGSREYIKILTADFQDKIKLSTPVVKVIRTSDKITVYIEQDTPEIFDHVIFACHADQALKIIDEPSVKEKQIIGGFSYQQNNIFVHSDTTFMPSDKKCWASWVYLSDKTNTRGNVVSLSYWMNNLQNLKTSKPIIITLNPSQNPDSNKTHDTHSFSHPIFDQKAIDAQNKIVNIQGENNTWFVGAYQRYGFHEDGILSTANMLEKMGVPLPWK